ncbi:hypothetical protein QQ045_002025 [Rhodiola kirilowii]
MLEHLEPLFVNNNVNMAFWGHVHRYERFCPLNNFTCGDNTLSKGFTIHVVIGMGGQDWQPIWEPRSDHLTDLVFPQPERSLFRAGAFGYTRIYATKEKLSFSYVDIFVQPSQCTLAELGRKGSCFPYFKLLYRLPVYIYIKFTHHLFDEMCMMGGSVRSVCVLIASIILSIVFLGEASEYPAMFVIGDSLVDSGNNNYLNSLAKSNYFPYGIDYPQGPSGRFNNGKTIVDFVGELIGIPSISTYADPLIRQKGIKRGVNFASAADGILEESGSNLGEHLSFESQVRNLKRTIGMLKEQMGDVELGEYLAKSLVVVVLGSNDYINNYLVPSMYPPSYAYDSESYAQLLINLYATQIQGFRCLTKGTKEQAEAVAVVGLVPEVQTAVKRAGRICDVKDNEEEDFSQEDFCSQDGDFSSRLDSIEGASRRMDSQKPSLARGVAAKVQKTFKVVKIKESKEKVVSKFQRRKKRAELDRLKKSYLEELEKSNKPIQLPETERHLVVEIDAKERERRRLQRKEAEESYHMSLKLGIRGSLPEEEMIQLFENHLQREYEDRCTDFGEM